MSRHEINITNMIIRELKNSFSVCLFIGKKMYIMREKFKRDFFPFAHKPCFTGEVTTVFADFCFSLTKLEKELFSD